MKLWLYLFILVSFNTSAQEILYLNNNNVCVDSIFNKPSSDSNILLIFSDASLQNSSEICDYAIEQVANGASLYCGMENEPFQAQCKYILEKIFSLSPYEQRKNLAATTEDNFATTPTFIPMKEGFEVIIWQNDQPVMVLTKYGKGEIIFDGSYARFYCENLSSPQSISDREIMNKMIQH